MWKSNWFQNQIDSSILNFCEIKNQCNLATLSNDRREKCMERAMACSKEYKDYVYDNYFDKAVK